MPPAPPHPSYHAPLGVGGMSSPPPCSALTALQSHGINLHALSEKLGLYLARSLEQGQRGAQQAQSQQQQQPTQRQHPPQPQPAVWSAAHLLALQQCTWNALIKAASDCLASPPPSVPPSPAQSVRMHRREAQEQQQQQSQQTHVVVDGSYASPAPRPAAHTPQRHRAPTAAASPLASSPFSPSLAAAARFSTPTKARPHSSPLFADAPWGSGRGTGAGSEHAVAASVAAESVSASATASPGGAASALRTPQPNPSLKQRPTPATVVPASPPQQRYVRQEYGDAANRSGMQSTPSSSPAAAVAFSTPDSHNTSNSSNSSSGSVGDSAASSSFSRSYSVTDDDFLSGSHSHGADTAPHAAGSHSNAHTPAHPHAPSYSHSHPHSHAPRTPNQYDPSALRVSPAKLRAAAVAAAGLPPRAPTTTQQASPAREQGPRQGLSQGQGQQQRVTQAQMMPAPTHVTPSALRQREGASPAPARHAAVAHVSSPPTAAVPAAHTSWRLSASSPSSTTASTPAAAPSTTAATAAPSTPATPLSSALSRRSAVPPSSIMSDSEDTDDDLLTFQMRVPPSPPLGGSDAAYDAPFASPPASASAPTASTGSGRARTARSLSASFDASAGGAVATHAANRTSGGPTAAAAATASTAAVAAPSTPQRSTPPTLSTPSHSHSNSRSHAPAVASPFFHPPPRTPLVYDRHKYSDVKRHRNVAGFTDSDLSDSESDGAGALAIGTGLGRMALQHSFTSDEDE